MKYTSAEAAKLLRSLNEELDNLSSMERSCSTYTVSIDENPDDIRPEYSYDEYRQKRADLESKIRYLKHKISCFNLSTIVPDFDMTIDQMLVYIPQLTASKARLQIMANRLPKNRSIYHDLIEYNYVNYDLEQAKADFEAVRDELARAQTSLDTINNSALIDIEL